MGQYQFFFYDDRGERRTLDLQEAAHDADAARRAFADLREHLSCRGVEVFEGDRLVARLERPSDAYLMRHSGIHGAG